MYKFILAVALLSASTLASKDGAGNGVSKTTYAATDPSTAKDFLMTYYPVENADDSCTDDLCACTSDDDETWYIQQGRVALETSTSLGSGVSRGFGLHTVNLTKRETTGGNTVSEVEAIFADKFGDMSSYDAFMDYSVGMYTTNIDQYIEAYDADSVDYLTTTWTSGYDEWSSISVLVPGTMMVVELYGTNSSYGALRRNDTRTHKEVRLGEKKAKALVEASATLSDDLLYTTRISRGTADLDAIDSFYTDVMGASLDIELEEDGLERHCFLYTSSSTVDVCFTTRDDDATSSDYSIADFESMMNTVHSNLLESPLCGLDKWLDNHHAFDAQSSDSAIVTYLDSDEGADTYYYCSPQNGEYVLHYIIDPTGWGIQLDMTMSSEPSGCSDAARQLPPKADDYNPACDLGTC